jgi:hypothetical protein
MGEQLMLSVTSTSIGHILARCTFPYARAKGTPGKHELAMPGSRFQLKQEFPDIVDLLSP